MYIYYLNIFTVLGPRFKAIKERILTTYSLKEESPEKTLYIKLYEGDLWIYIGHEDKFYLGKRTKKSFKYLCMILII